MVHYIEQGVCCRYLIVADYDSVINYRFIVLVCDTRSVICNTCTINYILHSLPISLDLPVLVNSHTILFCLHNKGLVCLLSPYITSVLILFPMLDILNINTHIAGVPGSTLSKIVENGENITLIIVETALLR